MKYNQFKYLKKVKARTTHQCSCCGKVIFPSEYYFMEAMQDRFLHSLHARRFCIECKEKFGNSLLSKKTKLSAKSVCLNDFVHDSRQG